MGVGGEQGRKLTPGYSFRAAAIRARLRAAANRGSTRRGLPLGGGAFRRSRPVMVSLKSSSRKFDTLRTLGRIRCSRPRRKSPGIGGQTGRCRAGIFRVTYHPDWSPWRPSRAASRSRRFSTGCSLGRSLGRCATSAASLSSRSTRRSRRYTRHFAVRTIATIGRVGRVGFPSSTTAIAAIVALLRYHSPCRVRRSECATVRYNPRKHLLRFPELGFAESTRSLRNFGSVSRSCEDSTNLTGCDVDRNRTVTSTWRRWPPTSLWARC